MEQRFSTALTTVISPLTEPVQSSLQPYSMLHTSEACLFMTLSDQCITYIVCSPLYATRNLSFHISFPVLLGSVIYPSTMYCNRCSLCCRFRTLKLCNCVKCYITTVGVFFFGGGGGERMIKDTQRTMETRAITLMQHFIISVSLVYRDVKNSSYDCQYILFHLYNFAYVALLFISQYALGKHSCTLALQRHHSFCLQHDT
jgi:hypothetical protein